VITGDCPGIRPGCDPDTRSIRFGDDPVSPLPVGKAARTARTAGGSASTDRHEQTAPARHADRHPDAPPARSTAMLTRVTVSELRVGMYVHELCGSWLEHPFWRRSFAIDSPEMLERLRTSRVEAAWVDSSRNVAAAPQDEPAANALRAAPPGDSAAQAATPPVPPAAVEPSATADAPPPPPVRPDVPLHAEIENARNVCKSVRGAVEALFREARMGGALDRQRIDTAVRAVRDSVDRNPGALLTLARLKRADEYTYMHSVAVSGLMAHLARTLGLDEHAQLQAAAAGLLHDIGKIGVPAAVLNKPGKLTDEEFDVIRGHPRVGHEVLERTGGMDEVVLDVCLHHHERIDGKGYPDGLSDDRISLFARMGAVCDVYDAVTSDRPYKRAWTPTEALRQMASWRGGHFDEAVFRAFVRSLGVYPVGSLVRLKSQRLAVVTDPHPTELRKPTVRVVYSITMQEPIAPRLMRLADSRDEIVSVEDPVTWGLPPIEQMLA